VLAVCRRRTRDSVGTRRPICSVRISRPRARNPIALDLSAEWTHATVHAHSGSIERPYVRTAAVLCGRRAPTLVQACKAGSRGIAGSRLSLRLGRGLVITQGSALHRIVGRRRACSFALCGNSKRSISDSRETVILTMEVTPQRGIHRHTPMVNDQTEILDRVRGIPGVRSASWATYSPLVDGAGPQSSTFQGSHHAPSRTKKLTSRSFHRNTLKHSA